MSISVHSKHDRQVAAWLLACAVTVFTMIVLGGVTRLTNSGLSIVEWQPVMGIVPPLNEAQWQQTFDQYRQFPEYRKVNLGMSLAEFKGIFYFEYAHRVLGRLIGVIFLFPFLYFLLSGKLRPGLTPQLVALFVLGGLQGALGWFMVKSGLVDNPRVSQYRLTAHLSVAVAIYAFMVWLVYQLLLPQRPPAAGAGRLRPWALGLVVLVFLMIMSGGLVAGTRAGHAYNTFPLMAGHLLPPGLYATTPAWLAAFEDITTIQFNHRLFAYLLVILVGGFSWAAWRSGGGGMVRTGVVLLLAALALQVTLGISTLLLHVPVPLAAAHQGGAVLLLTAALYMAWALGVGRKPGSQGL